MTRQLESSVAYVWRAKVAGPGERLRHWRTRTGYYQVITHLLEAQGSSSLGMAEVVGRAGGGRSTVYAVAADGTLAEAYRAGTRPAVRMLADLAGAGPIDRLVAETKVWSFWPLRQAWLRELDELFPAAEFASTGRRLAASVARWRAAHPVLAATQAGLPPLCALEDLIIVSRYTLSPSEAVRTLAQTVRCEPLDVKERGLMSGTRDRPEPRARVLAATREELVRADAKATTLFATTGVAVGALLSGLLSGQWSPLRLQAGAPAWLWWSGAIAAAAALTALAGAMYPRTRRRRARTDVAAYFGDVVRIGRDELDRALAVPDRVIVVDQVYEISMIVARKYALIKVALVLTALSVALFITAVLLNAMVGV